MFARLEELNRRVWGDKVALATTAHALGGFGLGLLIGRAERFRFVAYLTIAFAWLAHIYAFLTMRTDDETIPAGFGPGTAA